VGMESSRRNDFRLSHEFSRIGSARCKKERDVDEALYETGRCDGDAKLSLRDLGGTAAGGQLDVRLGFTQSSMMIANRCHFPDGTTLTGGAARGHILLDSVPVNR
jgi:hypothetical protein